MSYYVFTLSPSPLSILQILKDYTFFLPMEQRKEWMSVPAFGEWDRHKGGGVPDYSVDFSKIREMRRRNRSKVSIGADDDLVSAPKDDAVTDSGLVPEGDPVGDINRPILERSARARPPNMIKKMMNYLNCCGPLGA